MSLAAALWATHADLAEAALAHPFVRGLGAGTLPLNAFRRYIAQDAYFLDAFARAYALALARSPDRRGVRDFFTLQAGALEERALHDTYAARWGVRLADVTPHRATLAYTDFLLATAALGSVGEICAAMTPCMRLYAHIGQTLAAGAGEADNPYREWIRTYADPAFAALAAQLEGLLDRYAADTEKARVAYRRAMTLELDFFAAHDE